jgi:hypothetical protein
MFRSPGPFEANFANAVGERGILRVVDDAQDIGRMTIMLDERESIFLGAGIDIHIIE